MAFDRLDFWKLTLASFRLLNSLERRQALGLVALTSLVGVIDILALASVMPAVAIIVEPEIFAKSGAFGWLPDFFQVGQQDQLVYKIIATSGLLLFSASALNLFLRRIGARFSVDIQTRMAYELMKSSLQAPIHWHLEQNSASLVRFFHSDIVHWGRLFILRLIQMSQQILGMILPLALLFKVAPAGAFFGVIIIGTAGWMIIRRVKPKLERAGIQSKWSTEGLVTFANNAVSGVRDIKLACRELQYSEEFRNRFQVYAEAHAALNFWPQVQSVTLMLLGQISILTVAILLYMSGHSSGMIAAQMALIALVVSKVLPSVNGLLGSYSNFWNVLPWVQEVVKIHQDLRTVNQSSCSNGPVIWNDWESVRCEGVGFKYRGQTVPALDSVSCKFSRGGLYGVVGESGAGKSTLIDLLVGLHEPTEGRVLVDDQDLCECDIKSWHRQIGYVPQFPYLADGTVAENVLLDKPPAEMEEADVWEALELANLGEFIRGLPEGLSTPVGDRGVRLSGGQRQRLAIARALFQKPQLLVLDESTSSLDQIAESEIRTALEKLHGRITVIVIAHRMTTVQDCDEILFLSKGKLEAQGRYDELLEKHEGFQRLAGADVYHSN
jgi:ATP-binding cassette subfamily C protein